MQATVSREMKTRRRSKWKQAVNCSIEWLGMVSNGRGSLESIGIAPKCTRDVCTKIRQTEHVSLSDLLIFAQELLNYRWKIIRRDDHRWTKGSLRSIETPLNRPINNSPLSKLISIIPSIFVDYYSKNLRREGNKFMHSRITLYSTTAHVIFRKPYNATECMQNVWTSFYVHQ